MVRVMTVRELRDEMERCESEYGKSFLDWQVYTEQLEEQDKVNKRAEQDWKHIKDGDDWEYFECAGFNTKMPKEKIFTINVNY